jgi:hypothetical protein
MPELTLDYVSPIIPIQDHRIPRWYYGHEIEMLYYVCKMFGRLCLSRPVDDILLQFEEILQ